jgi:alpha-galactosidase
MWAILAAPLVIGSDPRALTNATIAMLENPQVIAIDQDPLDRQGTLVETRGSGQMWTKPLAHGDTAIALLNRGTTPLTIITTTTELGLPTGLYQLHNLWTDTTTTTTGAISLLIAGDRGPVPRQR